MNLKPFDDQGQHQDSEAGTIATLSEKLAIELGLCGYSLTSEDIEIALAADFLFYAGWNSTYTQRNRLNSPMDETQLISVNEWVVIEPVIRAHCELMQAQRMEGTGSLGVERFGMSVSEAQPAYAAAKMDLPKISFVEPPFILDLD
ncbi:hypothetical protein [Acinetobacter sp. ANC 3813]|uniref:hypothetical protein n=1 Tax=Acinetobacter sp. ANC 3813 TaxID=1977873 RepID=UPI000A349BB2|nr:hypothetical protein [Acinetobacter sp. ANC 3813]OTG87878.1 hypothetical protein B9T34_16205 [Acinetobacter sp. ANC 3813]